MLKLPLFFVFLLVASFTSFSQVYEITTNEVDVRFNFLNDNTEGTIGNAKASIKMYGKKLESSVVSGTAYVQSLTTGNDLRDKHLKGDSYFNAEKYPEITFTSSSIKKVGSNYQVSGTLKMKGTEKKVVFTLVATEGKLTFSTLINAYDFGVSPKKKKKSDVRIEIIIHV
jgi:polyisoprenoid-binding protein YceI